MRSALVPGNEDPRVFGGREIRSHRLRDSLVAGEGIGTSFGQRDNTTEVSAGMAGTSCIW